MRVFVEETIRKSARDYLTISRYYDMFLRRMTMPEQGDIINLNVLEEVTPKIRALVHPMRLRIIDVLKRGEQPVSKIAETVGRSQALTSHQLSILRQNGIIRARRDGNRVYYSVVDQSALALLECIRQQHVLGAEVDTTDNER